MKNEQFWYEGSATEEELWSETDQWLFVCEIEYMNKISQSVILPLLDRHTISGIASIVSQDTAIVKWWLVHHSEEVYNTIITHIVNKYDELQLMQIVQQYLKTYESDHLDIRDQSNNNQPSWYTKTNTL